MSDLRAIFEVSPLLGAKTTLAAAYEFSADALFFWVFFVEWEPTLFAHRLGPDAMPLNH